MGMQISRRVHSEVSQTNTVCATEAKTGGSAAHVGDPEGEQNRRGSLDDRPRAHVDLNSAEVLGVASGGLHKREECDPLGAGLRRAATQFCRAALLGTRIFRVYGG